MSRVPTLVPQTQPPPPPGPVHDAVEDLLASTVLADEHQVARGDVRLVQGHDPLVVQCLQDLVLLQHALLPLCLVGHNLGHEELSCGVLLAQPNYPKAAPEAQGDAQPPVQDAPGAPWCSTPSLASSPCFLIQEGVWLLGDTLPQCRAVRGPAVTRGLLGGPGGGRRLLGRG